jgi:hypothetical protein
MAGRKMAGLIRDPTGIDVGANPLKKTSHECKT